LTRGWQAWNRLRDYDEHLIPREPSYYSATAGANPQEQFIVKDRCTSYNSAQRSMIVMQILLRAKYDETEKSGIRRLLNNKSYLACFPLHEGRFDTEAATGAFDRRVRARKIGKSN
jgi:anoctamin-4